MATLSKGSRALFEVDGPQHFQLVNHFHRSESDLKDQLSRDRAKNKYAIDNGYSLLRVAYTEFRDIEYWVNSFLDEVAKSPSSVLRVSNVDLYSSLRDTGKALCLFDLQGR